MEFIKYIIGFFLGFIISFLTVWLGFVYSYSEISLKRLWWGMGTGVGTALILLYCVAVFFYKTFK